MRCSDVQKQLALYVDGELSATPSAALEAHLQTCSDCARQAAWLRLLAATLAALPAPDPSADFAAQVRARLAARQAERAALRPRRWVFGFALAVAGCGVLWSLAYFLPPLSLPWIGWKMDLSAMPVMLAAAGDSVAETYRTAPLWWQQTQAAGQELLTVAGHTFDHVSDHPGWGLLMRGLWVALGLAVAGNVLTHFHQRRGAMGVSGG